jgi:hypothetical protein
MKKQEDIFENKILSSVVNSSFRLNKNQKLTGFLSRRGAHYKHGLMVIGRAVNSWVSEEEARSINELDNLEARTLFRLASQCIDEGDVCPMQWVVDSWGVISGYSTNRSAFWRVIKKLIFQLEGNGFTESNWSSHIVWSNLYKLSPSQKGNPANNLCLAQLSGCVEMLRQELHDYAPQVLVCLTGWDWAKDFFVGVDAAEQNEYVHVVGRLNNEIQTKVVVACHPQGKHEADWVKAVCNSLDCIESVAHLPVLDFKLER